MNKQNGYKPSRRQTLNSRLNTLLFWVLAGFCVLLTIANLCLVRLTLSNGEIGTWEIQNPLVIIGVVVLGLIIFLLATRVFRKTNKKFLLLVTIIYAVLAVVFLCAVWDPWATADSGALVSFAMHQNTDWEYVLRNPQQLGYLSILMVAGKIFANVFLGGVFINILFLILTIISLYKITDLLFRNDNITKVTLFLVIGFLPLFFLALWVYNDMAAVGLLVAATWQVLALQQSTSQKTLWVHVFLAVVLLSGAILIRPNAFVGGYSNFYLFVVYLGTKRRLEN